MPQVVHFVLVGALDARTGKGSAKLSIRPLESELRKDTIVRLTDGGQRPKKREDRGVELLDRSRWRTRVELANAIFEYLEVFHNRQRRHSAIGMRTPIEYEILHQTRQPLAS